MSSVKPAQRPLVNTNDTHLLILITALPSSPAPYWTYLKSPHKNFRRWLYNFICLKLRRQNCNLAICGPIPWGHSGPLCHALSLSSSLSSLWTSMRRRRATVQWRHLVNWHETARCGEWAQHFSNASCFILWSAVWKNAEFDYGSIERLTCCAISAYAELLVILFNCWHQYFV